MSIYYVRETGDNGNDGLTPATAKLTLNGAEDIPVAAGDTIYIGAGTYRETLTCDVSGTAGSPITYIGDYTGQYTGDAGLVRITGSDDDITPTRNYAIENTSSKHYRTFKHIKFDLTVSFSFYNWFANYNIIDGCYFGASQSSGCYIRGATYAQVINSYFNSGQNNYASMLNFSHNAAINDTNNIVNNCIFIGSFTGVKSDYTGGISIKNCTFNGCYRGVTVSHIDNEQTITVNNSILFNCYSGALYADAADKIIEDYNAFYGNQTDRTNVAVGANSNTYPPLFDARWFFESIDYG